VPWQSWKRSTNRPHCAASVAWIRLCTRARRDKILCIRHLLERHDIGLEMLETVTVHLESKGIRLTIWILLLYSYFTEVFLSDIIASAQLE